MTSNLVRVINTSTNTATGALIGVTAPSQVAITPDGTRAYVTSPSTGTVSFIDVSTDLLAGPSLAVGSGPLGLAFSPDGARAYVTGAGSNDVSVIDTATMTLVGSPITVGDAPVGIDITADGTRAYVVNQADQTLSVIDLATNTVSPQLLSTGTMPFFVAITPNDSRAYVPNSTSASVSVFGLDTPPGIAANLPNGTAGTSYSASVAAAGSPVPTFAVTAGALPAGLTLDPGTGVLNGTPTVAGSFAFTITASSTVSGIPMAAVQAYTLTIASATTGGNAGGLADTGIGDSLAVPMIGAGLLALGLGVAFGTRILVRRRTH